MRPTFRWLLCATLLGATSTLAQTFRYASSGDILTLDPHSGDEALTNSFKQNLYEGLIRYDAKVQPEAGLAVRWTNIDPVTWRLELRRGVTFHDGTPFTADDVVFSLARQKSKTSGRAAYVASIKSVRKIDDHMVEIVTD